MARMLFGFGVLACLCAVILGLHAVAVEAAIVPVPSASIANVVVQRDGSAIDHLVRTSGGEIRYRWTPAGAGDGAPGSIRIDQGSSSVLVRYTPIWAGRRITPGTQRLSTSGTHAVLTQIVSVDGQQVTLTLTSAIIQGSLIVDAKADHPLIAELRVTQPASLNPASTDPVRMTMPYDPMPLYRTSEGLFASTFFDWATSAATRLEESSAIYAPRSDGSRNILHERLIVTASPRLADVLPSSYWPRSRYYGRVGGRVVIDITETLPFAKIEQGVDRLIAGGLSDCVVIVHVWQRLGYDNGLPVVLPANAYLGGNTALRAIGDKVKAVGCEFALHQNYVDQYDNSGDFDPRAIGRDADGQLLRAWLNAVVGQQSYALRPDRLEATARRYAAPIKASLGSTASFIDVNSSFLPWERVDMDALQPGGGRFNAFLTGSKAMFEAMQEIERGPVFGEGHRHFYWTGALDGVEAEMTSGYEGDVRTAPLWVDFDLLRIHPVQHNYGMGYYNRYAPATRASHDPMTEERTRDIYRAQELAFAHLPYRSGTMWDDVRLFVQEAALSTPVAKAYARASAREIRYPVNGSWKPIEEAWPLGAAHAVRVRYDNGLVVTANTGIRNIADPIGRGLGEAGWSATGKDINGWSTTFPEGRRDFMRAPDTLYADPRGVAGNWTATGATPTEIDFGPLRTDGQTWLSCRQGRWTVLGIAQRGSVTLDVDAAVIPRPNSLRGEPDTPDLVPGEASRSGFWRVRLISGRRYTTNAPCSLA